jgi:hypothetical protein
MFGLETIYQPVMTPREAMFHMRAIGTDANNECASIFVVGADEDVDDICLFVS